MLITINSLRKGVKIWGHLYTFSSKKHKSDSTQIQKGQFFSRNGLCFRIPIIQGFKDDISFSQAAVAEVRPTLEPTSFKAKAIFEGQWQTFRGRPGLCHAMFENTTSKLNKLTAVCFFSRHSIYTDSEHKQWCLKPASFCLNLFVQKILVKEQLNGFGRYPTPSVLSLRPLHLCNVPEFRIATKATCRFRNLWRLLATQCQDIRQRSEGDDLKLLWHTVPQYSLLHIYFDV